MYLTSAEDVDRALEAKQRAVALVPADPSPERARALSGLGRGLALMWRYAESVPYCEEAIVVARATGARAAELEAMATLGIDLCYLGRADEGLEQLEAARQISESHRDARELSIVDIFGDLSDSLIMLGRLRDGAEVALEGLATAARLGVERSIGTVLAANACEALFGLGEWQRAGEVEQRALRLAYGFMRHVIFVYSAQLRLGLGALERVRAQLDEAAAGAEQSRIAHRYFALVAELALWDGRFDDARDVVSRALVRTPPEAPVARLELCALGLRVEAEQVAVAQISRDGPGIEQATARAHQLLGSARGASPLAISITPVAVGWRALVEAEHARVLREPAAERWAAAADAWDELEQPYLAAYSRWRHAEALVRAGAPRSDATIPAREAHAVCVRLGARLLQRELEQLAQRARLDLHGLQADDVPTDVTESLGLTAREAQVFHLLGRGSTNREIAAELTITSKTASVHVSHILRKLDVSSRLEAAAIAQRLGSPAGRSASGGSAASEA